MSSSEHVDSKGKDSLNLGEGLTQGLDDTTLTGETKCPSNFTQSNRKFTLSLNHNRSNRFVFVKATKIYQFKAKHLEINNIHRV